MSESLESSSSTLLDAEKPQRGGSRSISWSSWWLEIVAMIFSVSTLVAATAVLIAFDKKPLDQWSMPWQVKPNTLVSLLMTLCRLSMLLVAAECIGQLKWIYFEQQPHELVNFAFFDEASAIAIDPFAQQILSFPSSSVSTPSDDAKIWQARAFDRRTMDASYYDDGGFSATRGGPTNSYWDFRRDHLLYAAERPMMPDTLGGSDALGFTCRTGNCSWEAFDSLGFCSFCEDITPKTNFTCGYRYHRERSLFDVHELECKYDTPTTGQLNALRGEDQYWPGTHTMSFVASVDFNGTTIQQENTTLLLTTVYPSFTPTDIHCAGGDQLSSRLSVARLAQDQALLWQDWNRTAYRTDVYENISSGWNFSATDGFPPVKIWDCGMAWCKKAYPSSSVFGGVKDERPKETTLHVPFFNYSWNGHPSKCLTPAGKCKWERETTQAYEWYTFDPKYPLLMAFPPDEMPSKLYCPTTEEISASKRGYVISFVQAKILNDVMRHLYFDRVLKAPYSEPDNGDMAAWLYGANNGDLPKTMNSVATAVTDAIRQGPNATLITGNMTYSVTIIQVNWPWLVYPASLVFITGVFMSFTTMFSAEQSNVIWKSSSLANLFHGLHGFPANRLQEHEIDGMERAAKTMLVKLEHADDGSIKLVKA